MAVIEGNLDRVVSDRVDAGNGDGRLSSLQRFLPGPVAANLCRGGEDPQKFRAEGELGIVIKG